MRNIFLLSIILIAAGWGAWHFGYKPYAETREIAKNLSEHEQSAGEELAEEISGLNFEPILPKSKPDGYYLIKNDAISLAFGVEKITNPDFLNLNYTNDKGMPLKAFERALEESEVLELSESSSSTGKWNSTKEILLKDGSMAKIGYVKGIDKLRIPDGSTEELEFEEREIAFSVGSVYISITSGNNGGLSEGKILSDDELLDFANAFLRIE